MRASENIKQVYQHFEYVPMPVVISLGSSLHIDFVNPLAVMLFKSLANHHQGNRLSEYLDEIYTASEIENIHDTCFTDDRVYEQRERRLICNIREEIKVAWYDILNAPLKGDDGRVIGIISFFKDITERTVASKSLDHRQGYLSNFFRKAPVAIVCYRGPNFIVDLANDKALEMWGKTIEEVKGRPIHEIFPEVRSNPEISKRHEESVARLKSGGAHIVNEVELTFIREGRRHTGWFNYIHEPYTDSNGHIIGMMAVAIEITEQVEARKKIQLITDALPALISYIDRNETYQFVNKAYEKWFGKSPEEVVGKTLSQVLGKEAYDKIKAHVDNALAGKPDAFEDWIVYQYGPPKFISANYIPDVDENSKVIGFFSLVNDLTDRKKIEEQLLKINELSAAHAFLQQIIDSSVECVAVFDRDLRFLTINSAFETFNGFNRTDLIGRSVLDVYPVAKGTDQLRALQRVLNGEQVHLPKTTSVSRPDRWFDSHYFPLWIDGKVDGVIAMSRDVTDIIKSERELANANRLLADAQRLSKLGHWELDLNTNEVRWSDEMYRIYGYNELFPVDFKKAMERMSSEDATKSKLRTKEHVAQAVENFKRTGETLFEISTVEFPIVLEDGTKKLLRNTGKVQLSVEGEPTRILGVVQDITQIRSTEEKLRVAIGELESKNKELESFNYVASHDLQEPLRKIQTFIDRIKIGTHTHAEVNDYVSKIDRSAQRMKNLIQSMLTLSRFTNSDEHFKEVDLNLVLENCKSDLEVRIRESNAVISSTKLPVITASEFQMNQLFINLISNSLKFSDGPPLINIECVEVDGKNITAFDPGYTKYFWCLSFTDKGIGFDPKYKQKIFELFQRLHDKHEYAGTGVGLSIVKKIVDRHQGFIDVESEVGRGTKFSVWLPVTELDE